MLKFAMFLLIATGVVTTAGRADADDWTTYRYQEEGFSVEFPGVPKATAMDVEIKNWVRGVQYLATDSARSEYLGQAMRYQPQTRQQYSSDVLLRSAIDGAMKAGKCRIRSERNFSFPGATAREVVFENCDGTHVSKARFLLVRDWHYLVLTYGALGVEKSPDSDRFLNSFHLLSQ
jgi:hypothetical protein